MMTTKQRKTTCRCGIKDEEIRGKDETKLTNRRKRRQRNGSSRKGRWTTGTHPQTGRGRADCTAGPIAFCIAAMQASMLVGRRAGGGGGFLTSKLIVAFGLKVRMAWGTGCIAMGSSRLLKRLLGWHKDPTSFWGGGLVPGWGNLVL